MKTLFDFAKSGMKAQAEVDKLCYQTKLLSRNTNPETSKEAAQRMIDSGQLQAQEQMVLYVIKNTVWQWWNDFTAKEISNYSSINYYTIQRRLSGLERKGKIERLNKDGGVWKEGEEQMKRNGCQVWRLK